MFKRLFTIVLAVLLLFSVSACKKNAAPVATQPTTAVAPTVIGVWNADVDLTDEVDNFLYAQLGSEHICTEFKLPMVLTLAEDGTYTISVDSALLSERLETLGRTIWQIVVDQAAARNGMTEEAASETLRKQGKDHIALIEELDLVSFFKNTYCHNGVWKQEGNVLYFAEAEAGLANAEGYPMTMSEQQLTLEYPADTDENGNIVINTIVWTRG